MSDTHRLRPAVRRSRRQARLTVLGLGLVLGAFGCAVGSWWWHPAVLVGYALLAASSVGLRRRRVR